MLQVSKLAQVAMESELKRCFMRPILEMLYERSGLSKESFEMVCRTDGHPGSSSNIILIDSHLD